MEEFFAFANRLSSAGLASLLLLILWGSWKEIWTWSRDITKLTARYEALLAKEQLEKEWWRALAIKATGIAEMQGTVAKALATSEKGGGDKAVEQ